VFGYSVLGAAAEFICSNFANLARTRRVANTGAHRDGLAPTAAGQQAFRTLVATYSTRPRSLGLSGGDLQHRRAQARTQTTSPVELAARSVSQRHDSLELHAPIVVPQGCTVRRHWSGDPDAILTLAAQAEGASLHELRARARTRNVVAARRLALLTWAHLNRPLVLMARALGNRPVERIRADRDRTCELARARGVTRGRAVLERTADGTRIAACCRNRITEHRPLAPLKYG
jgi:hypothetical protein